MRSFTRVSHLAALLVVPFAAIALANRASAQVTVSLNPKATYLHTNSDSGSLASTPIDLVALGVAAGQWLRIEQLGDYDASPGADEHRYLLALFSSSATLLPSAQQQRVPGALAAGPAAVTGNTWFGSQPTDVTHDFWASNNLGAHEVTVLVPAGATHLFLAALDSLYNDNSDPDGDYGARLSVVAAPPYPGTNEDLELRSGVGAAATNAPQVKSAAAGALLTLEVDNLFTTSSGASAFLFMNVQANPLVLPGVLAGTWFGPSVVLLQGPAALPASGTTWSATVPPGLTGLQLVFQGAALAPLARNGLYVTTHAHRIALL